MRREITWNYRTKRNSKMDLTSFHIVHQYRRAECWKHWGVLWMLAQSVCVSAQGCMVVVFRALIPLTAWDKKDCRLCQSLENLIKLSKANWHYYIYFGSNKQNFIVDFLFFTWLYLEKSYLLFNGALAAGDLGFSVLCILGHFLHLLSVTQ